MRVNVCVNLFCVLKIFSSFYWLVQAKMLQMFREFDRIAGDVKWWYGIYHHIHILNDLFHILMDIFIGLCGVKACKKIRKRILIMNGGYHMTG